VTGAGNGIGQGMRACTGAHGASVVVNDLGTSELRRRSELRSRQTRPFSRSRRGGTASRRVQLRCTSNGCCNNAVACPRCPHSVSWTSSSGVAGALLEGSINATDEEYQRFIDLFFSQKFWLARAAVPAMAERGGAA
jgi:NAD(P)-dependent dehydrogenase (short-subunit alcohol dehydrogenase family)